MSSLSLRLPNSLHRKIRELADQEDISINQFIASAVAEKAAALLTVKYLEERGSRGNRRLFDRILKHVPDIPAERADELPEERSRLKISLKEPSRRQSRTRSPKRFRATRR